MAISFATSGATIELALAPQNADMLSKKETIKEAHISFSSFDHITRKVVRCDLVIIILYYLVLSPLLLLQLHLLVLNVFFFWMSKLSKGLVDFAFGVINVW